MLKHSYLSLDCSLNSASKGHAAVPHTAALQGRLQRVHGLGDDLADPLHDVATVVQGAQAAGVRRLNSHGLGPHASLHVGQDGRVSVAS